MQCESDLRAEKSVEFSSKKGLVYTKNYFLYTPYTISNIFLYIPYKYFLYPYYQFYFVLGILEFIKILDIYLLFTLYKRC